MLDVKETLTDAEERMDMAAMYLEEQLARIRAPDFVIAYPKNLH